MRMFIMENKIPFCTWAIVSSLLFPFLLWAGLSVADAIGNSICMAGNVFWYFIYKECVKCE